MQDNPVMVYGDKEDTMRDAFQEVAATFTRMLDGMTEAEVHAAWLELVRAQAAIDRAALLYGAPA